MSKLNKPGKNVTTNIKVVAANRGQDLGYSANGNLQFKKEPLVLLYELVVTTLFGKPTMNKSSDTLVQNIRNHVRKAVNDGDYDFIANLALHARTEMNIRTIPIIVVVELAKAIADRRAPLLAQMEKVEASYHKLVYSSQMKDNLAELRAQADALNYTNLRQLTCDVIQRADQITDLYAYALDVFGGKGKIPMALKRGVADAFNKFGAYAFAKYNRDGSVKLRDVLRIVHPAAKSVEQGVIFEKIMKDTLEIPYTWETELSMNGSKPEAERKSKKQLWTELVSSGKVGYMALLRNLRNIHEAGLDSDVLKMHVLDVISDPQRVAASKQLPFDFIEAYNVVKPINPKMATAVSKAIDASVKNIPQLGKKVWLIVDFSGSMGSDGHEYGTGQTGTASALTTSTLLAAYLLKANEDADNVAVTLFGSAAKTLAGVDTNDSVLGIKQQLLRHRVGSIAGSTNFGAALADQSQLGFVPDTIVVLTDNEMNRFPYGQVRNLPKNCMKIVVNMSVSATTPMTQADGWYSVAGWSTAMFKWVPAIREKVSVVEQLSVPYIGLPAKPEQTTKTFVKRVSKPADTFVDTFQELA